MLWKRRKLKRLDMKSRMKIRSAHCEDGQEENRRHANERRHGKKDQEKDSVKRDMENMCKFIWRRC